MGGYNGRKVRKGAGLVGWCAGELVGLLPAICCRLTDLVGAPLWTRPAGVKVQRVVIGALK